MKNKRLQIITEVTHGITLITLIITIIVMLILAGVTISMVVGDNGVLNQAENAGKAQNYASAKEQIDLSREFITEGINAGKVDLNTTKENIKKLKDDKKVDYISADITQKDGKTVLEVKIEGQESIYIEGIDNSNNSSNNSNNNENDPEDINIYDIAFVDDIVEPDEDGKGGKGGKESIIFRKQDSKMYVNEWDYKGDEPGDKLYYNCEIVKSNETSDAIYKSKVLSKMDPDYYDENDYNILNDGIIYYVISAGSWAIETGDPDDKDYNIIKNDNGKIVYYSIKGKGYDTYTLNKDYDISDVNYADFTIGK